jgi:asparagine synthase (glutamine-hydrolysing)
MTVTKDAASAVRSSSGLAPRHRHRPLEALLSIQWGLDPWAPHLPAPCGMTPRQAVEAVVVRALRRQPCLVSFSGGRDSSAVLAIAAEVARREGLPLPIPVSHRFPRQPETDESGWQELVVRHARVQDWLRLEWDDELDLIGPCAGRILRRHGVLHPFNAHFIGAVCAHGRGGSVLTGFGGDELMEPWDRRTLAHVVFNRHGLSPRVAAAALRDLTPPRVRRFEHRRRSPFLAAAWIRPRVRRAIVREYVDATSRLPLRWDAGLKLYWRSRTTQGVLASLAAVGRAENVIVEHPFADPDVLVAFGEHYGPAGPYARARTLRETLGDVVPREVVRRQDKVMFDSVFFNRHSRAFAATWDGTGIDDRLVSIDALRAAWASPRPPVHTYTLLQTAWLSGQERGVTSAAADEPAQPLGSLAERAEHPRPS